MCRRPAAAPTIAASRLSTFMWMSSSAREKAKRPASISPLTWSSPSAMASASAALDDALCASIATWALRAGDVLGGELAVEVDGGVDLLHDLGRAGGEPAAPHLVAHAQTLGPGTTGMTANVSPDEPALSRLAALALAAVAAARCYTGRTAAAGKAEAACSAASQALARKARAARARRNRRAAASSPRRRPRRSPSRAPTARSSTLADFRGRALVLNLWATWCVPCRAEMPALDRLQAKAGGHGFRGRRGQRRHRAARARRPRFSTRSASRR